MAKVLPYRELLDLMSQAYDCLDRTVSAISICVKACPLTERDILLFVSASLLWKSKREDVTGVLDMLVRDLGARISSDDQIDSYNRKAHRIF